MISDKIKFGTDGWRAVIAREYTFRNVARLSTAVAQWAKQKESNPKIVIGYDCRFSGKLFAEMAAKVFVYHEIQVFLSPSFVSTPAVALAARDMDGVCGVVITASHNPPSYNGYKLKGDFGGPMQEEDLKEIESLIPAELDFDPDHISLESDFCSIVDLEERYIEAIRNRFDIAALRGSGLKIAVDAMFGSGQNVWRKIFPDATLLHAEVNPTFNGVSPEPVFKNLTEFRDYLQGHNGYDLGIANDGDADRIALFDGKGNYIDSHHVILLLAHYLAGYQKKKGKVVTAFSSVSKINALCAHYDLPLDIVKIGFKHASKIMIAEEVMLAGEESGGIAISDHVPERDGIWSALSILEFMYKTGKSISGLIDEVYDLVGSFHFLRDDLRLSQNKKDEVVAKCKNNEFKRFGEFEIQKIEDLDGYKYWLSDDSWVMIRPSGTEPVLRVYVQGESEEGSDLILKSTLGELNVL